jgi:endonuclease YncB( thermonuclease family)
MIFTLYNICNAQEYQGLIFTHNGTKTIVNVKEIIDGDTIKITTQDGSTKSVRLLGINTPEKQDPWGTTATSFTAQLLDKDIELWISTNSAQQKDEYGRLLGIIVYENQVFNTRLLEIGLAVRLFMDNDMINFAKWEDIEVNARLAKRGIWKHLGSKGVIINEINPNPYPDRDDEAEFVELYNTNSIPVDISGWSIGNNEQTVIPPGIIIPANGYVILARNSKTNFRKIYPATLPRTIVIDVSSSLVLPNNYTPAEGLVIHLKDEDKVFQDSLCYNLKWDNAGADNTGNTLERIDPGIPNFGDSSINGIDDDNWAPSLRLKGTPGSVNRIAVLLGDFGSKETEEPDGVIDVNDLNWFIKYWYTYQNSPENSPPGDISGSIDNISGTPPKLNTQPDSVVDFNDLMVFTLMWNWWYKEE